MGVRKSIGRRPPPPLDNKTKVFWVYWGLSATFSLYEGLFATFFSFLGAFSPSSRHVLLRFCLKNDKNNDKL